MRIAAILLLYAVGAGAAPAVPPPEPVLADFASTMPISIKAGESLYVAALPLAVYAGSGRRDLGDIRVFNGAGEAVSYALQSPATVDSQKFTAVQVPLFPLWAQTGAAAGTLSVRIEQGKSGAIVGVRGAEKSKQQSRLAGYIVDVSALGKPLQAITMDWAAETAKTGAQPAMKEAQGFAGQIDVESSDDLRQWTTRVSAAPLITLEHEQQLLRVNRVELPHFSAKYLRLSWPATQETPKFTGVRAEPVDAEIDSPRTWDTVTASAGSKTGEYLFDMKAHAPFDRLRLGLPNPNTVATVQLLSRAAVEDAWRPVVSPAVYRLNQGGRDVVNPDMNVQPHADRFWLLRLDSRTSIGHGMPTLSAGFVPQKIVFAARGTEPFVLAYGAANISTAAIPVATLVPGYSEDKPLMAAAATLGEPQSHGVASTPSSTWTAWVQLNWKKIALWSVLVLGAGVLGWMALRLGGKISAG